MFNIDGATKKMTIKEFKDFKYKNVYRRIEYPKENIYFSTCN